MVRVPGLDQLGNRRYKAGTKSTRRLRVDWQASGVNQKAFDVPDEVEKFDTIQKLGAADLFVCDEFKCDWGITDDIADEQIAMFLYFNTTAQPQADPLAAFERSELLDLVQWRAGTAALSNETTRANMELGQPIELAADDSLWQTSQFERSFGMDLLLSGVSSTLSDIIVAWTARGHRIFNLAERAQPMREWAGYEFEETNDDEEDDGE